MKKLLLTFFLAASVSAEDIYVSQSGAGTQNGSSAANARAMTWFNTAGNWNSSVAADGNIGPGDIVHFTGTITSVAQIQNQGTLTNRITLRIDPGAKFSRPNWPDTGAIAGTNVSHITIEGSNPGAGDGTIVQTDMENSNNGTALGSQSFTRMVYIAGSGSNITVQNLVVRNIYVRTYNSSDTLGTGTGCRIEGNDNLVIENCYFDNAETGCNIQGNNVDGSNTGIVINNNWIVDCANGVKISTGTNAVMTGSQVTRNRIDKLDRWASPSGSYHLDGIQSIADASGSSIRDSICAYNHIGPYVDVPGGGSMTSLIYYQVNVTGLRVYNNYLQVLTGVAPTNEVINIGNTPVEQGLAYAARHLIANNTITGDVLVTDESGRGIHAGYANITGNIINVFHEYQSEHNLDKGPTLSTIIDRNLYYGTDTASPFFIRSGPGAGFANYATWQGLGFDANGKNNQNPLLNSNGTLQAGSPAIDMAATQTAFTDDFNGNPRTGVWDAGAFEASSTPSGPNVNVGTVNVQNLRIGP